VQESYNEKEARDMCVELISAIRYCHERGIAHRDIKPSNILLTSRDDDAAIKLTDFGTACRVADGKAATRTRTNGFMAPGRTTGYTAPEIILEKPHDT
ncbi:unnamed protein product, partial [Laminaria digitata]